MDLGWDRIVGGGVIVRGQRFGLFTLRISGPDQSADVEKAAHVGPTGLDGHHGVELPVSVLYDHQRDSEQLAAQPLSMNSSIKIILCYFASLLLISIFVFWLENVTDGLL